MIKVNSISITIVSLIASIIFFVIFNNAWNGYNEIDYVENSSSLETQSMYENNANNMNLENEEQKNNTIDKTEIDYQPNWVLEIPEIDLIAEISEGTTSEVMNKYIGHFEETKNEYGNIGLAAHNRGYPVNFFKDLKKLKKGSEIKYRHNDFEMTYVVETIEIIENTNWNYLKNTEDNCITLITCVENEPKYRRCVQGIEKVESEEF